MRGVSWWRRWWAAGCLAAVAALSTGLVAPVAALADHPAVKASGTVTGTSGSGGGASGSGAGASGSGAGSGGAAVPGATTTGNPLSGGISPFAPLPTTSTTTTAPAVTNATTNTSGSSSLSGSAALVIAIGAIVVLGGIALFIWRDARRRAPVRGAHADRGIAAEGRRAGSKPPPKPRKLSPTERKRRKRGRAQR